MGKKDQFQTRAIHVGNEPDNETGAIVAPIPVSYTHLTLPTILRV